MILEAATGTAEERLAKIKTLKERLYDDASTLRLLEELQGNTWVQRQRIAEKLRGNLNRWNTLARGTYIYQE
jgi:hypothetical protein